MARKKERNRVLEKIEVLDYAAEGRSLARVDGKVIFIERTVPGDVVDVFLVKSKKDWAEGYPLKFHTYSPTRIIPFCQHFGNCGGCQWQMVPYAEQLRFKQQQVLDALQRIGKIPLPDIAPIIGGEEDRFYRNKLEYTFGAHPFIPQGQFNKAAAAENKKNGEEPAPAAGFHARGFFDKVVDISKCWLQNEPTNEIREAIRAYAGSEGLSFYDPRLHTGFLRNVQLRICVTGEVMVNIIIGEDEHEKIGGLLKHLEGLFPSVTTWIYMVNTKKNDSIYDLVPVTYRGKGFVVEKLGDLQFKIGPISFFQTNTKQAEQLYRITREFAELSGKETVYDLYCGTGSIGLFVSQQAKKVIGVELIAAAIENARENAELNQIANAEFFAGDVIEICDDDFVALHGKPDVIITDPPRAGMHEKLARKILEIEAPLVVYVSCNPSTQARDLQWLDEKYIVTKVQPVDMFPHTHHTENVVQLKLKKT